MASFGNTPVTWNQLNQVAQQIDNTLQNNYQRLRQYYQGQQTNYGQPANIVVIPETLAVQTDPVTGNSIITVPATSWNNTNITPGSSVIVTDQLTGEQYMATVGINNPTILYFGYPIGLNSFPEGIDVTTDNLNY